LALVSHELMHIQDIGAPRTKRIIFHSKRQSFILSGEKHFVGIVTWRKNRKLIETVNVIEVARSDVYACDQWLPTSQRFPHDCHICWNRAVWCCVVVNFFHSKKN